MNVASQYGLILADPAWDYRDKCNSGNRGASHKYHCPPIEELKALDIQGIAAPDCLLAMWWVGPMPLEAVGLAQAWGFTLKNMTGFTWVKRTKHGKRAFGMGHYTRGNAENCLFAVRGKVKRVSASVSQLIEAPIREHSRKPDEQYERLEALMGDIPRLELFARRKRDGWDAFGNEIDSDIKIQTNGDAA